MTIKRIRVSVTAIGLLVLVLIVAAVAATIKPGSSEDPLISKAYITETYVPQALEDMAGRAAEQTASIYSEVLSQWNSSELCTFGKEEVLELFTGGSLVLVSGSAAVNTISGALVDATDGTECLAGDSISLNHRYIVAEDSIVTIRIMSESTQVFMNKGSESSENEGDTQLPFTDVGKTDWYYPYILYVYQNSLFNGTAKDTFSPNADMNRAMLATVLFRFDGSSEVGLQNPFSDVKSNEWYTDGISWAVDKGIVNGTGTGIFEPDNPVTREQIAVMLYRYAGEYLNMPVSQSGDMTAFTDTEGISSWAEDAVSWAVGAGIISGMGDGTLAPGSTATRAQVSAMLQRFSLLFEE